MKEIFLITKLKVLVNFEVEMVLFIEVNGKIIYKMVEDLKSGLMVILMKVNIKMD